MARIQNIYLPCTLLLKKISKGCAQTKQENKAIKDEDIKLRKQRKQCMKLVKKSPKVPIVQQGWRARLGGHLNLLSVWKIILVITE